MWGKPIRIILIINYLFISSLWGLLALKWTHGKDPWSNQQPLQRFSHRPCLAVEVSWQMKNTSSSSVGHSLRPGFHRRFHLHSFLSLSLLYTLSFLLLNWKILLKAGNKATNRNINWPQPLLTQGGRFLYWSLTDSLKPFLIDGWKSLNTRPTPKRLQ